MDFESGFQRIAGRRGLICADTNTWIAYFKGERASDVRRLEEAADRDEIRMIGCVLAELTSDPKLPIEWENRLLEIEPFPISSDDWYEAGKLRARMCALGYKPKLADTLIAQVCIDNDVPLLTRDRDFSMFKKHAGLKLA